ncbi:MAG: winged helix-turn-helix domain-containing protein [Acidobacteriaceae bacterium]|nr:winged helix-turn-helix domain-containing protein [Acidobacteriaceae bacterium]
METSQRTVFTFATFVFDPVTGELTNRGRRVPINQQIADLLTLLLENAGTLVTREQIKHALWPDQNYLNHDKILTNAVSRLRYLMGDRSTEQPYIVNIPKRGYRFEAKVQRVAPVGSTNVAPLPAAPTELSAFAAPERRDLPAEKLTPPAEIVLGSAEKSLPGRSLWYGLTACLVLVVASAGWYFVSVHRQVTPQIYVTTVGIPPFQTPNDPASKELAESFRLDLTDSLSDRSHVAVRAAHSLEAFDIGSQDFRQRAIALGLDVLVLGHFQLQQDRCQLDLELVHGSDLSHIITLQYSVPREQIARLRDQVQHELPQQLTGGRSTEAASGVSNDAAYDAYLRAGYHLSQPSPDSMQQALQEYKQAIRLDPGFAKAYSGQARAYFFLQQAGAMPAEESLKLAQESARKALELDPHSAEPHAILGLIAAFHEFHLAEGEKELAQAISIDPNLPFYRQGMALLYCEEGQFTRALAQLDIAHANDPFWVSAYITDAHISGIAGNAARLQQDIAKLRQLAPNAARAADSIANAEWNMGQYTDAIQEWHEMALKEGDHDRAVLEEQGLEAFRRGGVSAYARVRIQAIHDGKGIESHPNDFVLAEWYPVAGERQLALQSIHEAIDRHDTSMLSLAVLPNYSSLRNLPEFTALVKQAGLTLVTTPVAAH